MKQLLRLNQIRSQYALSAEATVRTLLSAWALHERTTVLLRTLLSATTPPEMAVVSSWLLSGLGLDTLRQQVHGRWSEARLQTCVPRLRRFLCSRPRRRGHQESTVRVWGDAIDRYSLGPPRAEQGASRPCSQSPNSCPAP
jgi:hypothetical protein